MKFLLESVKLESIKTEILVVPVFEDDSSLAFCGHLPLELKNKIKEFKLINDFSGEKNQLLLFHNIMSAKRVLLVGLGKQKDFDLEILREITSTFSKYIKAKNYGDFAFYLCDLKSIGLKELARAFTESAEMSFYIFDQFKSKKKEDENKKRKIHQYSLVVEKADKSVEQAAQTGIIMASGNMLVRKLANTPSNELTPAKFADISNQFAKENKLKITVMNKNDIIKKKMGLIHAVSKGSKEEPKFIILEYKGDPSSKKHVTLVGKGVTFDTGGINLKPSNSINTMKYDMAGAATVLATIICASKLKLKKNISVFCPMVENMPSGEAYKPDDVFTAYNGKTVEVANTDAEGRLILADALSYALEFKPQEIIDVATLTGAAVHATGNDICPIITNNENLAGKLLEASKKSGEKIWQLPLAKEYEDMLKSDVADIKNVSDGPGPGTILGALFLKNFMDDTPWAHLDIAGVGWTKFEKKYYSLGPTGFGVRLLTQFLMDDSAK